MWWMAGEHICLCKRGSDCEAYERGSDLAFCDSHIYSLSLKNKKLKEFTASH